MVSCWNCGKMGGSRGFMVDFFGREAISPWEKQERKREEEERET